MNKYSILALGLSHGTLVCGEWPQEFNTHQRKKLLDDAKFYLWDEPFLYKIELDKIIRRYVPKEEAHNILRKWRDTPYGGHFGG